MQQKPIALPPGEAEYYGVARGEASSKGTQSILKDMGINLGLEVLTDSSAAKRIATRRGLGQVRHIDTCQLWVKPEVQQGHIRTHFAPPCDAKWKRRLFGKIWFFDKNYGSPVKLQRWHTPPPDPPRSGASGGMPFL